MIEEDVIIKYDITLGEVYLKKAEKDGWLYIKLSIENWLLKVKQIFYSYNYQFYCLWIITSVFNKKISLKKVF